MAIIHNFEKARTSTGKLDHGQTVFEPVVCKVCGEQMFKWRTQRLGISKTACFSATCLNLSTGAYPIGMIRGDLTGFSRKDHKIRGSPFINYPSAGNCSAELREKVKKLLEKWGFIQIGFVEPTGKEKSERDTVITGIHKSALVNITFQMAPKTQRVFSFENKFGAVALETAYHEDYEKRYYSWSSMQGAVHAYGKENLGREYLYPDEDTIYLSCYASSKDSAEQTAREARKRIVSGSIREAMNDIGSFRRKIKEREATIADLVKKYEAEFGESYPHSTEA